MILAAGRGERLRPLTDSMPKPMVPVGDKPILEHLLERLATQGLCDFVINLSYRAEQIVAHFGDGSKRGWQIVYSHEDTPLETAGGVRRALPSLGTEPFIVVNADVWTDYDFGSLASPDHRAPAKGGAHLILVDNPSHHRDGDFELRDGIVLRGEGPRLTFAGIGLYDPAFFAGDWPERVGLATLIDAASANQLVSGEHYQGTWVDLGTLERVDALRSSWSATR